MRHLICLLAMLAAGCGAHVQPASPSAIASEMERLRSAYQRAFNAQDERGLAALYAPEATIYAFTGGSDTGGPKIASVMMRVAGAMELRLKPRSVRGSESLIVEAGEWEHVDRTSNAVRGSGFYSWTWRKTATGAWQIDHQIVTMRPR